MEIKDLQPNQGNIDLVFTITEKGDVRTFSKFGKTGRVCTALAEDETGKIKLTLWNEDIDLINVGDKLHLQNGWCSEYQGEKQLSTGKFGKIEIIEKAAEPDPKKILTNDPQLLSPEKSSEESTEESPEEESEPIQDEEIIE